MPLAERLCRALHRLIATGVPGPHHCLQRIFLAAHSERVLRVLRTLTDTSGARERRASIQSHSTSGTGYGRRAAAGGWAASSLRAQSCLRALIFPDLLSFIAPEGDEVSCLGHDRHTIIVLSCMSVGPGTEGERRSKRAACELKRLAFLTLLLAEWSF